MTKLEYASTYAVIATLMVVFMLYIGRNTDKRGIHVRRQLHLVFVLDVIYFISFFMNNVKLLIWNHCIVQVLVSWVLVLFVDFSITFAEEKFKNRKQLRTLLAFVTICDSVMLIYNAYSGRFFSFSSTKMSGGGFFVYPNWNMYCTVHFAYCILLVAIFVGVMVKKAIESSALYRGRYIFLSVSFVLGVALCAFFKSMGNFMNFPIVIFLTLGQCTIFYVYYHLPKMRINKMKNFVIKNVTMPIMMFDYDDELQVYNDPAADLVDIYKGLKLSEFSSRSDLKYILTPERRAEGKTKEFTLTTKVGKDTYLIHGQELWDENNSFIGTLLVYNDISGQEKLKEEADFHATRDTLTGLWNREYFMIMVQNALDENPRQEYVLILSDILQFKMFNEILGKGMGDDLLLSIAKGFQKRKKDDWIFARLSSDRFAMLMPKEDFDEDRFIATCRNVINRRAYKLSVHFYLGVYEIDDRSLSVEEMCDRADMALESIHGDMRKYIAYFDETIRNRRLSETINTDQLETALAEKQFVLYLQPQIDSIAGKIVGCEALVRWISPDRGIIPPMEFIPSFEENGMIAQLDYYVWEMACQQLKKWKDSGDTDRSISVNVSAKDFGLSDIYTSLTKLVERYDINPANLKLEITETAFVMNVKEQMVLVKKLRSRGFLVEIDDFGSGYSSLNSLKDIDVDVLKLDMKFFEKTDDEERAQKIIESVIALAYNLKMPVVAEGVETEEQVKMLQRLGCKIIQGYYYAKPMPVEEYEEYMKKYPCEDIHVLIDELKKD